MRDFVKCGKLFVAPLLSTVKETTAVPCESLAASILFLTVTKPP